MISLLTRTCLCLHVVLHVILLCPHAAEGHMQLAERAILNGCIELRLIDVVVVAVPAQTKVVIAVERERDSNWGEPVCPCAEGHLQFDESILRCCSELRLINVVVLALPADWWR